MTSTLKLLFDPDEPGENRLADLPQASADRRPDPVYRYTDEIKLALNVALATGRPLLLRGDPGSGKSTLARHVAFRAGWRYYEVVVTGSSRATDLQWTFDTLERLRDAHVNKLKAIEKYVRPGPLWRALAPDDAAMHAHFAEVEPYVGDRAVVLIDEIDKADPDFPNDLLSVLGSHTFAVTDMPDKTVTATKPLPLIVLTSNRERELPDAFLRRCVVKHLPLPTKGELAAIAAQHFPIVGLHLPMLDAIHERLTKLAEAADTLSVKRPSTAEYLDTIRACQHLGITDPASKDWKEVSRATMWKVDEGPPGVSD